VNGFFSGNLALLRDGKAQLLEPNRVAAQVEGRSQSAVARQMKALDHIAFDMDGTLVDTREQIALSLVDALPRLHRFRYDCVDQTPNRHITTHRTCSLPCEQSQRLLASPCPQRYSLSAFLR
jgi:hypothetical protein